MLKPLFEKTRLQAGEAMTRRERNRAYLMRLKTDNLLLSHYFEAGLKNMSYKPEGIHWGWDSPTSEIRGIVAGHWLSAAARIYAETGDTELKARADHIVSEIARCQAENGGQWAFPIPEKYLHWLKRGKNVWAPQYVCHKNMMGLLDMYMFAGNQQAFDVLLKEAAWFYDFTSGISRENMNEMMEQQETGGMMMHWANLYAVTHDEQHLELMRRYERPLLFDALERGDDILTNMHANTTIPEVQGAARAYEVTGEERYRRIVENYWEMAVNVRGMYATGGQTCGEIWTPMGQQSARLSEMNQEHCTVYNMMLLSQFLFRWTGKAEYADYYERNLYNGIFAQGYWEGRGLFMLNDPSPAPMGLVTYYLPLSAGSIKKWGSETEHFWCCHCTLMQANATMNDAIYFEQDGTLVVAQYIPSELECELGDCKVKLKQGFDGRGGESIRINPVTRQVLSRPQDMLVRIAMECDGAKPITLKFRRPWWLSASMECLVNGQKTEMEDDGNGFVCITRQWYNDVVVLSLPKALTCWPLPDRHDTVAFMDGPVVLAGLVGEELMLYGSVDDAYTMLKPDDERRWTTWLNGWRTVGQPVGWRFIPLYEVGNETYTVYFPVRKQI
jgi:hypothetical protein